MRNGLGLFAEGFEEEAQIVVCVRERGISLYCVAVAADGILGTLEIFHQYAEVKMGSGIFGIDLNRGTVMGLRAAEFVGVVIKLAEIEVGVRAVRVEGEGHVVSALGFLSGSLFELEREV